MIKIVKNKTLLTDLMQSIGYFAFLSGFFTVALPLIKENRINVWPFIIIFLFVIFISYVFTLSYVLRPIIQTYYPEFGLYGLDACIKKLPWYHPSKVIFSAVSIIAAWLGFYIASMGML